MPISAEIIVFCAKYLVWIEVAAFLVYLLASRQRTRIRLFLISLIASPIAYVLARIAGNIWYDARPFVADGIPPLLSYTADNGFPSDHVLLAATLASIVTLRNPRLSALFWLMAIVIAIARVMAHVHYPVDVIASAVLGAFSTVAAYYIVILRPLRNSEIPQSES